MPDRFCGVAPAGSPGRDHWRGVHEVRADAGGAGRGGSGSLPCRGRATSQHRHGACVLRFGSEQCDGALLGGEGPGALERFLRFTLIDIDGDGCASFGGPADILFSVLERGSGFGAQAGGFLTVDLVAPGVLERLDGTDAPLSVFLPAVVSHVDLLRFRLSGTFERGR